MSYSNHWIIVRSFFYIFALFKKNIIVVLARGIKAKNTKDHIIDKEVEPPCSFAYGYYQS